MGSFLQVKLLLNFPHSNILGQGHNGLFYKHERGIKSFWISSLAHKIWLRAYQKSGGVPSKHIPGKKTLLHMLYKRKSIHGRRPPTSTRDLATWRECHTLQLLECRESFLNDMRRNRCWCTLCFLGNVTTWNKCKIKTFFPLLKLQHGVVIMK